MTVFWLNVAIFCLLREAADFRNELSDITRDALGLTDAINRGLLGRVRYLVKQRDALRAES